MRRKPVRPFGQRSDENEGTVRIAFAKAVKEEADGLLERSSIVVAEVTVSGDAHDDGEKTLHRLCHTAGPAGPWVATLFALRT